jgi:hypothetical protein
MNFGNEKNERKKDIKYKAVNGGLSFLVFSGR